MLCIRGFYKPSKEFNNSEKDALDNLEMGYLTADSSVTPLLLNEVKKMLKLSVHIYFL